MGTSANAWKHAKRRAGLPDLRIRDLKHTFCRRLRAAGVSFEDCQDLVGHKSARMTTHYFAPELERLIEAAESVCDRNGVRPGLVIIRGTRRIGPKNPHEGNLEVS